MTAAEWLANKGDTADCPCEPYKIVQIKFRNGAVAYEAKRADTFDWQFWEAMPELDIVEYKMVDS